jgi:hypothetical protein
MKILFKRKALLVLCVLPLWVNAQTTIQVLDSVVSYHDGNDGVKYEYQYDNKGVAISETDSYWDNSSNLWVKNSKCEYQYDDNKNQTLETYYLWDNNTWTKMSTAQYNYHYSTITVNSILPPHREQSAMVFPNPATNYITVKGIAESIITVSDLSGKMIDKQVMAGESKDIDVSSWASGVYLISVEKGNNRTVSKIVKN